jgi:hypothetical protein
VVPRSCDVSATRTSLPRAWYSAAMIPIRRRVVSGRVVGDELCSQHSDSIHAAPAVGE